MKQSLARIALTFALILFPVGLLAVYTPAWYAVVASLAGVSACFGAPRARKWGMVCFVAAFTLMVALCIHGLYRQQQRGGRYQDWWKRRHQPGTNQFR